MTEQFHIAIVGSGPSGLSAAGRAAHYDRENGRTEPTYVLLESDAEPSKTIRRYQKGKHVMSEPGYLELRSDFAFAEGSREQILQTWNENLSHSNVNVRYGSEVTAISGTKGDFVISLANGNSINPPAGSSARLSNAL